MKFDRRAGGWRSRRIMAVDYGDFASFVSRMLSGAGLLPGSSRGGRYQGVGVLFVGRLAIACYNNKS
ncbi:MAG: hypothetical protein IPM89_15890 [Candidatus Competibacteraceae bacterium]|nr:MAG: hypothetical protein IPM89_15890 [Candidatus Competibacteraceae bacterium]